jgi:hypothetical protein
MPDGKSGTDRHIGDEVSSDMSAVTRISVRLVLSSVLLTGPVLSGVVSCLKTDFG